MVLDTLFFLPRGKIRHDKLSFETWEAVKLGKLEVQGILLWITSFTNIFLAKSQTLVNIL